MTSSIDCCNTHDLKQRYAVYVARVLNHNNRVLVFDEDSFFQTLMKHDYVFAAHSSVNDDVSVYCVRNWKLRPVVASKGVVEREQVPTAFCTRLHWIMAAILQMCFPHLVFSTTRLATRDVMHMTYTKASSASYSKSPPAAKRCGKYIVHNRHARNLH